MIKLHVIVMGIAWEATGVIGLVTTLWFITGSFATACNIGILWPVSRVTMWPVFDWVWKRYCRKFYCAVEIQTDEAKEKQ